MYLIFYFDKNLCRPPFPSPSTWSLSYVIRASHTNTQHKDTGTHHIYYFEKHTKESPSSKQLPGPPIRIKGLPRYLSRTPIHLPFLYIISPYRLMNSTLLFKYLNMHTSTVINPYLIQIPFKVKVVI